MRQEGLAAPIRDRLLLVLALLAPHAAQASDAQFSAPQTFAATTASESDSTPPARRPLLDHTDLVYALGAAAAVSIAFQSDLHVRSEMLEEPRTGGALARAVQPLGNTGVVGPALLAVYGLGRWRRDRALTNAVTEIGLSALTTGVEVLALKEASGRPRPSDPGRDSDDMRMFSGDQSFPSGHTAISFALAEAINRSSGSRWAPWITFPVAAAVGWSRMRDDEHWLSDVVAGAAIGDWTARKVHRFERTTSGARHVQFGLGLTGRGVMLHGVW